MSDNRTSDERCHHIFPPHGHVDDRCCLAAGHKGPHVCDPLYDEPCIPQTLDERCEGRFFPPRDPDDTYRCSLKAGHDGPCGNGLRTSEPCSQCGRPVHRLSDHFPDCKFAPYWTGSAPPAPLASETLCPTCGKGDEWEFCSDAWHVRASRPSNPRSQLLARAIVLLERAEPSKVNGHVWLRCRELLLEDIGRVQPDVANDALNQATLREFISATPEEAEKIGRRIADAVRAAAVASPGTKQHKPDCPSLAALHNWCTCNTDGATESPEPLPDSISGVAEGLVSDLVAEAQLAIHRAYVRGWNTCRARFGTTDDVATVAHDEQK